jgi:hypothetical protein
MRRIVSLILAAGFFALGTGGLEYVHNLAHAREDAAAAAIVLGRNSLGSTSDSSDDSSGHPGPLHTDANCVIHAMLHAPLLTGGWVPLLVCLGLFVAFLTQLTPPVPSRRPLVRIDCRGPPAF